MNDWRQVKLGDIAETVTVGHVGSMVQEYRSSGVPLLRSQNVVPHGFDLKDVKYIDSNFHAQLKKSALKAGDVVTVRTGKPGATAVVPVDWDEANCSDLVITRPGSQINAYWLSYYINSAAAGYIDSQLVGAVQQHFNVRSAKNMTLNLPPLPEQQAIADVLRALDDKIAINTKLVSTSSEVLGATFASLCGQPEETVPFNELAVVTKGVSYRSADLRTSSTALVTLKSFNRTGGYSPRGLKEYAGPYKMTQTIAPGELTVALTDLTQAADVVGRAARVPKSSNYETLVASLDVAIIRPRTDMPVEFLLGVMLQGRFRAHCRSRTSGTTVLHLASDAIPAFRAPLVSRDKQMTYASIARPLLALGDSLEYEIESLESTRDAILPQLMSGKLRVKDAEKVLEAAGI